MSGIFAEPEKKNDADFIFIQWNVISYRKFLQFTNVSFNIECLMPFYLYLWVIIAKTDLSKYFSLFFFKKRKRCWMYIRESFHNIKYFVFLLSDHPRLWSKTTDGIYFMHVLIDIRQTWSYIYQTRLGCLTTIQVAILAQFTRALASDEKEHVCNSQSDIRTGNEVSLLNTRHSCESNTGYMCRVEACT